MKISLLLTIFLAVYVQSQKVKVLHVFDKQPVFDKDFSKLRTKNDTVEFFPYQGEFGLFSKENELYCKSIEKPFINPHDRTEPLYSFLKWNRKNCFNKAGNLVLKNMKFGMDQENVEEIFYLDRQKKAVKGSSIGGFLFQSTPDEILKVLERDNINPNSILSQGNRRFYFMKLITPSGEFWQFSEKVQSDSGLHVLIDDKTKKIVAKSYDNDPFVSSKTLFKEFMTKKHMLYYPSDFKFTMNNVSLQKIVEEHSGKITSLQMIPVSKKLWLLDYYKTDPEFNGKIMLIIEDLTGEILMSSEDYPKDYIGEEDFKKDVNKLLLQYKN